MIKYFLFLFFLVSKVYSACDFPTGNFIKQLSDPSQISHINIETPKSYKYARNQFKILTSTSWNIPPKLKKNFDAQITVHYSFGSCKYSGRIRQNGDLRDHISFNNGQPISSLDVKLNDGNIFNAVRFKLFLPETRNGHNEILASLILKSLGYIAPETFEVNTSVNGINSIMLFQEKAEKELLERNLRREGPIFEGDESIMWSYKDFEHEEIHVLALSRLINKNWFKKGDSSQKITLNAFSKLQKSYFNSRYNNFKKGYEGGHEYLIFPNLLQNNIFNDYHAILLAMNADHAFYVNNRKYYFNAIESLFEPIYYDGDPFFLDEPDLRHFHMALIPYPPSENILELTNNNNFKNKLLKDFRNRAFEDNNNINFFISSLNQFNKNLQTIKDEVLKKNKNVNIENVYGDVSQDWYKKFQDSKGVDQKIIKKITFDDGYYKSTFDNGDVLFLNLDQITAIFSENRLNNERVVYIPNVINTNSTNAVHHLIDNDKTIFMSEGIQIKVDKEQRTINFSQSIPMDWVLLSGGDYSEWDISFHGLSHSSFENKISKQRFNQYGLTGCLTIYKALVDDSNFQVNGGLCEDSINILLSQGSNIKLNVRNSFADAVDVDFSSLSIEDLDIYDSGNDCLDVSGGNYEVLNAKLSGCKDKALSIGEMSKLNGNKIFVNKSNIAVASKDLSEVKINLLQTEDVSLCAEIKQKKQEFGGAMLTIKNLECSSLLNVDENSRFINN